MVGKISKKKGKNPPADGEKKGKEKSEEKPKKPAKAKIEKKPAPEIERYFEATGRRKTAVARVRLFTRGEKLFLVNQKPYDIYFPSLELPEIAQSASDKMKCLARFPIEV